MSFALLAATDLGWSAGLGRIGAVAEGRGLVAVATTFPHLYWPGRAFYEGHRLRYRVVVYDRATRARVGALDDLRYPVHEMAFHAEGALLAIGTGAYDGGYAYEGELVVWDWLTGALHKPITEREVVRVRWHDAHALAVLVRPPTDEDDGDSADGGPVLHGGIVAADGPAPRASQPDPRLSGAPVLPGAFGFDGVDAPASPWAEPAGRPPIWDLAFVHGDSLATASDSGVALWDSSLRRSREVSTPGRAVQLLQAGSRRLVNVLRAPPDAPYAVQSSLYALHGRDLIAARDFEEVRLFSVNARGELLARDVVHRPAGEARLDLVLAPTGETLAAVDLGHFDCFNHALRLDGGEGHAFLRGTPATSHEGKVLASIDGSGAIAVLQPWDEGAAHRMDPTACWAGPSALIAGWYTHDPRPGQGHAYIERRDVGAAAPTWRVRVPFAPIALVYAEGLGAVVWATLDGEIGLLDAATGAILARQRLAVDGLATPPTAMAVRGDRLAVGTLDGRILLFALARPL